MSNTPLTDPLGRRITLHDQTWLAHIVKRHPEMLQHRRLVELAITQPQEIRHCPTDDDCRFYFGMGPRQGIVVLVVGDVAKGRVKTAHLVRAMKGAVEWSRQTPSKE
ncbi:MAG: hypothetical protein FWD61_16335 [Phycisphaerales bacterium]|nr:hypothetical protein [Phycisphaerales bacterium]